MASKTATKQLPPALPFEMVKVDHIVHSPTNPPVGTDTDRDNVDDLASSIESDGLLNPITVRERIKGTYEVVCGHRRFLAYQKLNRKEIPAFIRVLSDEEAIRIQIIENLQREDISPIDEAAQFAILLKKQRLDWLCSQIAKPIKYVQDRLKLNDLIPEAKEYVRKGIIPLGHSIMISKLTVADQNKCVQKCLGAYGDAHVTGLTRSQLRDFIEHELTMDMERTPFDTSDKDLVPAAGACTTCLKRSKCAPIMFDDMLDEDRCTDRTCFDNKVKTHLDKIRKEVKEEYGKVASGTLGWNSNEIKVGGQTLKAQATPGKNTTPVVITSSQSVLASSQSQIGKVVHVVLPNKEEKKVERKEPVESYEERQKRRFTELVFPRLKSLLPINDYVEDSILNYMPGIWYEKMGRHNAHSLVSNFGGEMAVLLELSKRGKHLKDNPLEIDAAFEIWDEMHDNEEEMVKAVKKEYDTLFMIILDTVLPYIDTFPEKETDEDPLSWKDIQYAIDCTIENQTTGGKKPKGKGVKALLTDAKTK